MNYLLLPLLMFLQVNGDVKPNGFDVSTSNIDTTKIVQGGPPRDGIPAIDKPIFIAAKEATWLKDTDPVVGFESGGISRAYPLRILQYHECVNDTVGKQAIAVTYCPLCQSSFVFDRNIENTVYDFGTSGMLWNSNVLLYDRQTESLWSQVAMKSVAGEAAKNNLRLTMLPTTLSTWKEWVALHPDTTVLSKQTGYKRDYDMYRYQSYFDDAGIWFDVDEHLENPRNFAKKDKMLLVQVGEKLKLYPIKELILAADSSGIVEDKIGDQSITILVNGDQGTVSVGGTTPSATLYWFSASACLPNATLWNPPVALTPADHPTDHPSDHPTDHPTDHPSDHSTDHPTDQPTDHPTDQPTDHPTDQPTDHPSDHPK